MIKLLDCTLRDGGYYNFWDFNDQLIADYLLAMDALNVDYIEIGFRSSKNQGFKGGCAYSTERFLSTLAIPDGIKDKLAVMVNGSELVNPETQQATLESLFCKKEDSFVSLVRIACHVHEFKACLSAASWLKEQGYLIGFNLMQIADKNLSEVVELAKLANDFPIDVLYFADSMGSLSPEQVTDFTKAFQQGFSGALGIHSHDNMGRAVANSLQAVKDGITWVDSTVTGMGRGPGNAQTEYLSITMESSRVCKGNPTKLFELIRKHFHPMQNQYGWGTNPYYFLAGKFGIHPTYIQEMLQDSCYSDEDIIAVIEYLKVEGGKKFCLDTLETARHFYSGEPRGKWNPIVDIQYKEVLVIGTGPSVKRYKTIIENYIQSKQPYVIALNTEQSIDQDLIHVRAACHPVRLLADSHELMSLPQPLITPFSMLPGDVRNELQNKVVLDFGLEINKHSFEFGKTHCALPNSLVISYVLAIANSGKASKINLVGFDGYSQGDPRSQEMEQMLKVYNQSQGLPICSLTPTQYNISTQSIFGI